MWKITDIARSETAHSRKILVTAAIIATYALLNHYLRIHLPGVSNVDLRPQIVLIFVAGYLFGPWYGFLAGFAGNFCTDILFGYGFRYLPSWTVGNGLVGFLIGFFPYRQTGPLERIGQMVWLVVMLIMVNILSLSYAAGMESLLDKHLPSAINFRYFYMPALLSNIMGTLILFPAILLVLERLKLNYTIKLSLAVYYLTVVLLMASWMALNPTYQYIPALLTSYGMSLEQGNALVDAFTYWSSLLVIFLIFSFVVSGWMSKAIISPLKKLEDAVLGVLKGDPASSPMLTGLATRKDEVGILSYTVSLLSEEYWETQKLSRKELEKNMRFIDAQDSGTDILLVALMSFFGKDSLRMEGAGTPEIAGELSNLTAVSLVISAIGLQELAATYSDAKIQKSFAGMDANITRTVCTKEQRQSLALAIDINLLFKGRLKVMDVQAPVSREMAFHLLERVHAFRGSNKKYVGYVTEPGIVGKMLDKWEKSVMTRSEPLERIMNKAISFGVITGYQIKQQRDLANFDINLTIAYSHSDSKHIKQLVGLLIGEDMQAKLQLEPKWSSFLFLDSWEKKENMHLEILDEKMTVARLQEYDMVMEFAGQEERDDFRHIIEKHAKREYGKDQRVLFDSFYQPLYRSDVPLEGYNRIVDIMLRDKTHIVQTFVKEEEAAAKLEWFRREAPDLDISKKAIWVNDDFLKYLNDAPQGDRRSDGDDLS